MTRRKDPQPENLEPEAPATAPLPAEPLLVDVDPITAPPTEPPIPDRAPPAPPPRQSGFFGLLLGGALTAIGGFALSHYNVLGLAAPSDTAALEALGAHLAETEIRHSAALDTVTKDLATVGSRLTALESAPPPEPPDLSRLDALDQRLAAIEAMPTNGDASTAALAAKLADLEQRLANLPATGSDPALQQKLDDALARLSAAEAEATARATEAEAAAMAAQRAKALDALSAAVAAGQPFTTELQALADPKLATALGTMAETGVPTLTTLQADFPNAAREALRIARDISAQDSWTTRLVDFLASQTGARSLTPREGDDPDAILSRAEFALTEGRVTDAVAELQPLDPAIRSPLDPWIAQATTFLAANTVLTAARGE